MDKKNLVIPGLVAVFSFGCLRDAPPQFSLHTKGSAHTLADSLEAKTFMLEGRDSLNKGEFDSARTYFERSLTLVRDDVNALMGRAYTLQKIGYIREAASTYEAALASGEKLGITHHADFAAVYNNVGSFYYEQGNYTRAKSLFEQALEINPQYGPSQDNLALLKQKGY